MEIDWRKVEKYVESAKDAAKDAYDKAVKTMSKTETEQKLAEALSSDNWGASTTLLREISDLTKDYKEYPVVMREVWAAIGENPKNWRQVFKGLTLLDYLVKNGVDRCVDEAKDRMSQLRSLNHFSYMSDNVEKGAGVREKSKALCELLSSKSMIKEEREKARTLRDKYIGVGRDGVVGGSSSNFSKSSSTSKSTTNGRYDDPPKAGRYSSKYDDGDDDEDDVKTKKKSSSKDKKQKSKTKKREEEEEENDDDDDEEVVSSSSKKKSSSKSRTSKKQQEEEEEAQDDEDEDLFSSSKKSVSKKSSKKKQEEDDEIDFGQDDDDDDEDEEEKEKAVKSKSSKKPITIKIKSTTTNKGNNSKSKSNTNIEEEDVFDPFNDGSAPQSNSSNGGGEWGGFESTPPAPITNTMSGFDAFSMPQQPMMAIGGGSPRSGYPAVVSGGLDLFSSSAPMSMMPMSSYGNVAAPAQQFDAFGAFESAQPVAKQVSTTKQTTSSKPKGDTWDNDLVNLSGFSITDTKKPDPPKPIGIASQASKPSPVMMMGQPQQQQQQQPMMMMMGQPQQQPMMMMMGNQQQQQPMMMMGQPQPMMMMMPSQAPRGGVMMTPQQQQQQQPMMMMPSNQQKQQQQQPWSGFN